VGPSEIHRADQGRVAVVSANLAGIDLGTAVSEVQQVVAADPLGADIEMRIGGQGEELAESISSLLFVFGLTIFIVYLLMASQFESVLHPFLLSLTFPLAMAGAGHALLLPGHTRSVVVYVGLSLMVGPGVKIAVSLLDRDSQLREAAMAKRGAVVERAPSRLRP